MGILDFFKSVASSPSEQLHVFRIPNENVDVSIGFDKFDKQKHYFTVRVNEMFLTKKRKWFEGIEPMVISLTGYKYAGRDIDDLFIVGKNLMKDKLADVSGGMAYYNTTVAGIHPYTGGRLTIGIVLCESVTKDYLKGTLDFLENITGILNKSIPLLVGSYTEIAKLVIGSIDSLWESKEIKQVIGCRLEFNPDSNDFLSGGYFAIIDKSDEEWNPGNFFVKDKRLYYGKDMEESKPFKQDEFVLFSITQTDNRSEITHLPLWQSYQKILDEAKAPEINEEQKEKMSAMLRVLGVEMSQSPDLTPEQAEKLIEEFYENVKKKISKKLTLGASPKINKGFWDVMDEKMKSL